jgi:hypothetical protein
VLEWQGTPGEIFVSRERVDPNDTSPRGTRDRTDPSYQRPLKITATSAGYRIVPLKK